MQVVASSNLAAPTNKSNQLDDVTEPARAGLFISGTVSGTGAVASCQDGVRQVEVPKLAVIALFVLRRRFRKQHDDPIAFALI